jgi:putative NADH-flavin reductase
MKLAIIGATGRVGTLLLIESIKRKLDVTAIVRSPQKLTVDVPYIAKDLFALTTTDLSDFDVVIDTFNAPRDHEELHQTSLAHLVDVLKGTRTRLLVVGGASSLYLDDARTKRMIDDIEKGAPFYETAYNMYQAYLGLKAHADFPWSYLSPAAYFKPDGERTGTYQLSDDRLLNNAAGTSYISMADYAIAMLDEAEQATHVNQHFSVVSQ